MPRKALKLNPCPFEVGDILRWRADSDSANIRLLRRDYGEGPFVVTEIITDRGNGPEDSDPPIHITHFNGDRLPTLAAYTTFWVGYFEPEPFFTAVRRRRHAPSK